MRSVFFGTPEFSVPALRALHAVSDVVMVVTREDKQTGRGKKVRPTPVKVEAGKLGIPVFQPKNSNDEAALDVLRRQDADLFVVVAYGQILHAELLEIPKKYTVNIHSSLLPRFRGAAPMQWAILEGDAETGVSLMQIEEGLDSGPVWEMRKTPVDGKDFGDIHDALASLGAELLTDFVEAVRKGPVTFCEQEHEKATYAEKIDDCVTQIDVYWESAEEIERKVRAFSPMPGAYLEFRGERIKIFAAEVQSENLAPGIFRAGKKFLRLGTREGSLLVKEIQRPGKKRMDIVSFLAGVSLPEKGEI